MTDAAKMISDREVKEEDYPELAKLISDTWKYEQLCGEREAAQHLSRLYLKSCLQNQTFTQVAVSDGKVVGVIMGRSNRAAKKASLKSALSLLGDAAKLRSSKAGRQISELFREFSELNKELLAECRQYFDGELVFFAVNADFQGLGIGRKLLGSLLDYLNAEGAHLIYVFTDATCNYTFYEKNGFTRIGEKAKDLRPLIDYSLKMFIYSYRL